MDKDVVTLHNWYLWGYRTFLQAFIPALDIDYESLFTCPQCKNDGHTIIIDEEDMGVNRKLFKAHRCCVAHDAAIVNIEW